VKGSSEKFRKFADSVITNVMENADRQYLWNVQETGCNLFYEWMNSSVFVPNNYLAFCTIATSSIMIDDKGEGIFYERTYEHTCNNFLSRLLSNKYMKSDKCIDFVLESEN
jgi:hypothetical protein